MRNSDDSDIFLSGTNRKFTKAAQCSFDENLPKSLKNGKRDDELHLGENFKRIQQEI